MKYEVFQRRILSMAEVSKAQGNETSVTFEANGGNFTAVFPDGTRIIGNADNARITVKFGKR